MLPEGVGIVYDSVRKVFDLGPGRNRIVQPSIDVQQNNFKEPGHTQRLQHRKQGYPLSDTLRTLISFT